MLLPASHRIRFSDDIWHCPIIRQEKSTRLLVHLFHSRISLRHVDQGIRHCRKTHFRRSKSIHTSFYICIRNRRRRLHSGTNELFQQSPRSILNFSVPSNSNYSNCSVNPLYYVTFTTATLCASFILFKGFNTTSAINTISLLSGFLVIFSGVYLLNFSRTDPHGFSAIDREMEFPLENGISAAVQGRRSLQGRRSNGDVRRASLVANSKPRQEDSLLRAFDDDDDDDIELGLDRVSEEGDDSIETLPEHHSPKSPRR